MKIVPSEDDVMWAFLSWLNNKNNADFYTKYRPDKIKGRNWKKEIDYIAEDRGTGKQIAIEESSFWRHDEAGNEAAEWTHSLNYIKQRLLGKVKGVFDISTPISFFVCRKDRENFSDILLAKLDLLVTTLESSKTVFKGDNWYKLPSKGPKPLDGDMRFTENELPSKRFLINVCGVPLKVNYENKPDSMIDFIRPRIWENDDRKLFSKEMSRIVREKAVKLEPYKKRGFETWLVIYSTLWTTTNIREIQIIFNGISEPSLSAVDHIVLVSGNPPDDNWVDELKIPGRNY